MTGIGGQAPPGDPVEDPLSLELLADLHAGVLDEQLAAQLRRRVAADAQARTVLAALDATVADLAALPQQCAVRMPDAVALRLDATLAAAGGGPATPVVDFGGQQRRRVRWRQRRRVGWLSMGLVAAAAATIVMASSVAQLAGVQLEIPGTPRAGDALGTATGVQPSEPIALTRTDLGDALDQALAARDFGPLSPPGRMQDCLAANGVADTELLGALEVTLDGRRGVLIVLPTGRIAQFRLLVVGPDCGLGNPSRLADAVVGRR